MLQHLNSTGNFKFCCFSWIFLKRLDEKSINISRSPSDVVQTKNIAWAFLDNIQTLRDIKTDIFYLHHAWAVVETCSWSKLSVWFQGGLPSAAGSKLWTEKQKQKVKLSFLHSLFTVRGNKLDQILGHF